MLLDPKGSICWQMGNYVENGEVYPLDILLYPVFKEAGLQLRNRIIWAFGHGSALPEAAVRPLRNDPVVHQDRGLYVQSGRGSRVPSKYPEQETFPRARIKASCPGIRSARIRPDVWEIPNVKANHVEENGPSVPSFPSGLWSAWFLALTEEGDCRARSLPGCWLEPLSPAIRNRKGVRLRRRSGDMSGLALDRIKQLRAGTLRVRPT